MERLKDKNQLMNLFTGILVFLQISVFILQDVPSSVGLNNHSHIHTESTEVLISLLLIPIMLYLVTIILQSRGKTRHIPIMNTLTQTFSSISIIVGGGLVE